ncbi:MAG: DUF3426 domain-containing protein [Mariprofundaceae bacterium]
MADKRRARLHHAPMRIVCPHCKAAYRVDAVPDGAVLVCHRCRGRFRAEEGVAAAAPRHRPEQSLPLFEADARPNRNASGPQRRSKPEATPHEPNPAPAPPIEALQPTDARSQAAPPPFLAAASERPTSSEASIASGDAADTPETRAIHLPPPMPGRARIWPWLAAMLLALTAAGFYANKDQWLAYPVVRGWMLSLHLPVPPSDDDWAVEPASVRAQWLTRHDGSRVLVVEGSVHNRLSVPLPPPAIEIAFFDPEARDRLVEHRILPITMPPELDAILDAPWSPPPQDTVPVPGNGHRAFVLVLEELPERIGDFTLLPRAMAAVANTPPQPPSSS